MPFNNARMNLGIALLCSASAVALASAARAQDAASETVVVTGSRVIADAANSPTPLTVVTLDQLHATSPTNIADALNKLPAFIGSTSSHISNNPSNNYSSNSLNLRNFGAQRVLVLLDGQRVVPSNSDGTVNIDTLPQGLMQRVDVVTGGGSAVYGSDAITGVVNFILDKRFSGLKFDANAGISQLEDGASYNFGVSGGSELFGGRGHIEGDVRVFHQDDIPPGTRLAGQNWLLTGAGTTANPYLTSPNVTLSGSSFGGKITCTGCAANNQQFIANGIVGPFNPGVATGTGGDSVGGDGAYFSHHSLTAMVSTEEAFTRFSYNLSDDVAVYVQGSMVQSYDKSSGPEQNITGNTGPTSFYANNPYLPAAAQAQLTSPSGTFTMQKVVEQFGQWAGVPAQGLENNYNFSVGADGAVFGKYDWNVFYTYGHDRLKEFDPGNNNQQKLMAAEDVVSTPGGGVACYVSTTTYASLYPGCVPANMFGPTSLTPSMYHYFTEPTYFVQEHSLHEVSGSISGNIFDDWAGPVKAALSSEWRWFDMSQVSNANPVNVNCIGLRICNSSGTVYQATTVASMPEHSESVWEIAGEVNIPLIKDAPLIQDFSLDVAGRYTDYSVTGSVETWKVGLDYHVNDQVRFRGTTSIDIRAPTIYDLYQSTTASNGGFSDLHTKVTGQATGYNTGNPNLVPEISRTYTGGVVFTPEFIPGLTFSVDYYHISMKNAVGSVTGRDTATQQLCEQSGGTSTYCALYVRPLAFSNTTPANYPLYYYSLILNSAFQRTEGWDLELNYGFQLGDVWADAPGAVNLRILANIAPVLESQPYPGAPLNYTGVKAVTVTSANTATAKGHVTSFVSYQVGSWGFNLVDRWLSGYPRAQFVGAIYAVHPRIPSVNYQDITIDKKFTIDGQTLDGYFTIQNIGNILPPLDLVNNQTSPGAFDEGINFSDLSIYDPIGRYFTIGIRAKF